MKLESKYNIGDTVYGAGYRTIKTAVTCPDCLGSGVWKLILPSGEELQSACVTCSDSYGTYSSGKITKSSEGPRVQTLTIGRVTYEADHSADPVGMTFHYMCEETGVGSGTVYREKDLYTNYEDALADGEKQACGVRENTRKQNEDYNKKRIKKLKKVYCPVCKGSGCRKGA